MTRLLDKIAFVTGAGGIGRSICERFLAEGAQVAAADISLEQAESAVNSLAEGQAIALHCDVGDTDSVRDAIARVVREFGSLTVLCNTAGGSTP